MIEYAGILLLFLFAIGVAVAFLVLTTVLGPKNPTAVKSQPFECGQDPFELPRKRLSVKFYILGMLFILFDIELIFLFPWAVQYRALGFFGFVEMTLFLLILAVGYIYAWKKGGLEVK